MNKKTKRSKQVNNNLLIFDDDEDTNEEKITINGKTYKTEGVLHEKFKKKKYFKE